MMRLKMSRPRSSVPKDARRRRLQALGKVLHIGIRDRQQGAKSPTAPCEDDEIPATASGRVRKVCATLAKVDRRLPGVPCPSA